MHTVPKPTRPTDISEVSPVRSPVHRNLFDSAPPTPWSVGKVTREAGIVEYSFASPLATRRQSVGAQEVKFDEENVLNNEFTLNEVTAGIFAEAFIQRGRYDMLEQLLETGYPMSGEWRTLQEFEFHIKIWMSYQEIVTEEKQCSPMSEIELNQHREKSMQRYALGYAIDQLSDKAFKEIGKKGSEISVEDLSDDHKDQYERFLRRLQAQCFQMDPAAATPTKIAVAWQKNLDEPRDQFLVRFAEDLHYAGESIAAAGVDKNLVDAATRAQGTLRLKMPGECYERYLEKLTHHEELQRQEGRHQEVISEYQRQIAELQAENRAMSTAAAPTWLSSHPTVKKVIVGAVVVVAAAVLVAAGIAVGAISHGAAGGAVVGALTMAFSALKAFYIYHTAAAVVATVASVAVIAGVAVCVHKCRQQQAQQQVSSDKNSRDSVSSDSAPESDSRSESGSDSDLDAAKLAPGSPSELVPALG